MCSCMICREVFLVTFPTRFLSLSSRDTYRFSLAGGKSILTLNPDRDINRKGMWFLMSKNLKLLRLLTYPRLVWFERNFVRTDLFLALFPQDEK